jgi:PEP-CTERM motif
MLSEDARRIDVSTLRRALGSLAGACGFALSVAAPASALVIAPDQSSIVPQFGTAESLSGTIDVAIGSLPLTETTTFDVVGLSASASDGTTFALDPASPSPGLGVVNVAGSFLIPTLFLAIDPGGGSFPLAIADVTGTALFDASGTVLEQLSTSFQVDSGGPAGILTITVVAVPEPASVLLAGAACAGLMALALRSRGKRKEIAR